LLRSNHPNVNIIDASTNDPWGCNDDDDDDDDDEQTEPQQDGCGLLKDLQQLPQALQNKVLQNNNNKKNNKPVMLIWEFLTPLLLVHGFGQMLQFLDLFQQGCLQVWPVHIESLTNWQPG
jgi:hypothetical protein